MRNFASWVLAIFVIVACGAAAQPGPQGAQPAPHYMQYLNDENVIWTFPTVPLPAPFGFPADFPRMMDKGGAGANTELTGFGGDHSKDKAGNRAAVKHVPVILLHGNGAYAEHPYWGMQTLTGFLKDAGYNDSEIWAVSYLGAQANNIPDMNDPYRNNVEDVRQFIDGVINYLGVDKVVLIGHSLGGGLCRCYLLGLDQDGSFKPGLTRFNKVKGIITLAAGHYGLGTTASSEFKTGSPFEVTSHKVTGHEGVWDDTPFGNKTTPATNQQAKTPLPDNRTYNKGKFGCKGTAEDVDDNNPGRIYYAGLTSIGDLADGQLANTGYLQGADINQGWNAPVSVNWYPPITWARHAWIIKSKEVFDQGIKPILEKCNQSIQEVPTAAAPR